MVTFNRREETLVFDYKILSEWRLPWDVGKRLSRKAAKQREGELEKTLSILPCREFVLPSALSSQLA